MAAHEGAAVAESVEHAFLSDSILAILEGASQSRLYAYKEADRKRFDFACDLATNWHRAISGQTLWKHTEGIDKDIRMLLSEAESEVLIYVARTTMKNKAVLHEAISDYKRTGLASKLDRLRVFWVPEDFDADSEEHRTLVYSDLQASVSKDLLLSVVLGGITARDVASFATWSGAVGLSLAALAEVGNSGFQNYTSFGKKVGSSAGPVKERIIRLSLTGFIERTAEPARSGSVYEVSPKGYALMDLCGRLSAERKKCGLVDPGLRYVCSLLGIEPENVNLWSLFPGWIRDSNPKNWDGVGVPIRQPGDVSYRLAMEIDVALNSWGASLPDPCYEIPDAVS
ncbi:hypothetical protein ACG2OD_17680 [Streptomyces sp. PDY-4]|uniref:hypothetical protein n=1 Tax=Streptomyces sp. PDY-4 TaxID=3376070 RepID=UPI00379EF6AA